MIRSKSLPNAEQLTLEEIDETQDSQAILDALKVELGVGTLSSGSSIKSDDARRGARLDAEATNQVIDAEKVTAGAVAVLSSSQTRATLQKKQSTSLQASSDDVKDGKKSIHSVVGRTLFKHHPPQTREIELDDAVIIESSLVAELEQEESLQDAPGSLSTNDKPFITLPPAAGRSQRRKMETSQQTPTQVNEDRDYGDFCNTRGSSPPIADTLPIGDEPRTLLEDDTGAVNFGNLSPGVRPSSQVSEDGGFENTRGGWRVPDHTSHASNNGSTPFKAQALPPETPAMSKNPFGVKQDTAIPFAGSQLFGQTQLPTSAVKVSPTSSRPSPHIFYNSISPPNIMPTSPLKNRTNVSSPTNIQTSSPQRLHDAPGTAIRHRLAAPLEETPCENIFARDDMIPESPTIKPLKSSQTRQPLAHYEPMKKSQERKEVEKIPPIKLANDSDSDDDAILKLERRKKIEKKKAQAAKEMQKVSFVRPARRELGDAAGRKRRRLNSAGSSDIQQSDAAEVDAPGSIRSDAVLRGSQKAPVPSLETAESTKATPGEDAAQASSNSDGKDGQPEQNDGNKEATDEEMIPATSPVRSLSVGGQRSAMLASEPELPPLIEDESDKQGGPEDDAQVPTSDLPLMQRRYQRSHAKQARRNRRNPLISSPAAPEARSPRSTRRGRVSSTDPKNTTPIIVVDADKEQQIKTRSSPLPTLKTEPVPLMNIPTRRRSRTPITPLHLEAAGPTANSSSGLTALSTTPVPSSKTTPDTQVSPESDRQTSLSLPSPAAGRKGQRRISRQSMRLGSPQPSARAMRMSTRGTRVDSESTDELSRSPMSSALELGMAPLKSGRAFRHSIGANHAYRGHRLFEGMAFAISMQSEGKTQKRSTLENKITQAGGLILQDGFHELFEPSTVMSTTGQVAEKGDSFRLVPSSLDFGFTALIADGHSRKVKYMQALALGLPCLAHQWITACLNKGELVDWGPYLLAAGSSAALGDAIRSRCLPPYPAGEARLAEIIDQRPKLLAGQSVLVVVDAKRARSQAKKEYIFLAQALGPSVYRVATAKEAREALSSREKAGDPFHWVYIDDSIGTLESVLSGAEPAGKKRKRASVIPVISKIRVLKDQLVIQSLILGRMIGEDEMTF
ncbi:DNA repair crb2-like protein [Cladobotryum mycophilum]|uniref:DNA repair crb2-like protein n=1 Tax=Cladobotryum mycophilum TaxID=491253 RepID=A0ABR0SNP5_9HYPO